MLLRLHLCRLESVAQNNHETQLRKSTEVGSGTTPRRSDHARSFVVPYSTSKDLRSSFHVMTGQPELNDYTKFDTDGKI